VLTALDNGDFTDFEECQEQEEMRGLWANIKSVMLELRQFSQGIVYKNNIDLASSIDFKGDQVVLQQKVKYLRGS